MIAPGAWLGLLGGGQLGRMFTMAAQSMGYRVMVLDPGNEVRWRRLREAPHVDQPLGPAAVRRLPGRPRDDINKEV